MGRVKSHKSISGPTRIHTVMAVFAFRLMKLMTEGFFLSVEMFVDPFSFSCFISPRCAH